MRPPLASTALAAFYGDFQALFGIDFSIELPRDAISQTHFRATDQ